MTNVNIIMNVDNDAFMHDNLGSEDCKNFKKLCKCY